MTSKATGSGDDTLFYATKRADGWEIQNLGVETSRAPRIALGRGGVVFIAYVDQTRTRLRIASLDPSARCDAGQ